MRCSSTPGVTAPIVGVTRLDQLKDAIAALDLQLSPEERGRLEAPYRPHAVRACGGRSETASAPYQVHSPANSRICGASNGQRASRLTAILRIQPLEPFLVAPGRLGELGPWNARCDRLGRCPRMMWIRSAAAHDHDRYLQGSQLRGVEIRHRRRRGTNDRAQSVILSRNATGSQLRRYCRLRGPGDERLPGRHLDNGLHPPIWAATQES